MRVCLVYDCLYPWTVGGAERWLRALAEELARAGHEVTYLTRRQWEEGDEPQIPGVRIVVVSRREELYGPDGNRTIGEPLRFGRGVLRHLLRHRRDYDVVHASAAPFFGVLGAGVALTGSGTTLCVDWFEVWSRDYWRRYLGGLRGVVGWAIQRLCARLPQHAFVYSELHRRRLLEEGLRGRATTLTGLYDGPVEPHATQPDPRPLVLFAGRHIPEKRVPAIPPAIAAARLRVPELHALVLGDGPERGDLLAAIDAAGVGDAVEAPGFVATQDVTAAMGRATCLLFPSTREGYGLVVIEAAANGTPSIVVRGEDNAAVELITEGVNGFIAASDAPEDLADAIVRAVEGGAALRARTADWFAREAPRLTIGASARTVLEVYEQVARR